MTEGERIVLSEAADRKCWDKRETFAEYLLCSEKKRMQRLCAESSFETRGKVLSMSSENLFYQVNCENIRQTSR